MQQSRLGKNDPSRRCTMGGPQALAQQKAGTAESVGLKWLSWSGGGRCPSLCPCKDTFLGLCLREVLETDPWYLVSQEASSLMGYSDNHVKVEGLRLIFVLREWEDTVSKPNCRENNSVSPECILRNAAPWKCFAISTSACPYLNWQCPCLITRTQSHQSALKGSSVPSARQREAE